MAMSLVAPLRPEPVLSPICQAEGRPARSNAAPVVLAIIEFSSCLREGEESDSASSNNFFILPSIADGLVVSRTSPTIGLVQGRLVAVKTRDGISEGAGVTGPLRGTAELSEQKIGCRVVTH